MHAKTHSPVSARRGRQFDMDKYTDLGRLVVERLERLDLRLSDAIAKVKGIDPRDTLKLKSFSGGKGSLMLRGLRSIPEEEMDAWAKVLKLSPGTPGHDEFVLLADWQRLAVACPHSGAADRLLKMIRRLRADLDALRTHRDRSGDRLPKEPEVLGG